MPLNSLGHANAKEPLPVTHHYHPTPPSPSPQSISLTFQMTDGTSEGPFVLSISDGLSPNSLIQTDGTDDVVSSNSLPSGSSATNMSLTNPSLLGTISTPLTSNSLVQTNSSSQLTASNTLTGVTLAGTTYNSFDLQFPRSNEFLLSIDRFKHVDGDYLGRNHNNSFDRFFNCSNQCFFSAYCFKHSYRSNDQ